ncbi:MAG: sensor histidine kinase [Ktedonobacterales bacterium]
MKSQALASSSATSIRWRALVRVARLVVLPVVVIAALVVWALVFTQPVPDSPPGAAIVLFVITLSMGSLVEWFRLRFDAQQQTDMALPDPLYTLYLAAFVLTGASVAIPLAALTPFVQAAPVVLRGRGGAVRTLRALRESAAATSTTVVAGLVYVHLTPILAPQLGGLRAEVVAAFFAVLVLFLALLVVRAPEHSIQRGDFFAVLWRLLQTPAARFQALLLTVGPLLPLADLLDDIEAEFAWILFLIPLIVVYYLALVSMRLEQRTGELQTTIGQLRASRRREAELTGYATLITRAQEDERRRLARELHDDTAQALIALSRGLDALSTRQVDPPLSSRDAHFIHDLDELAKRTLESVRRACQDLRPSVLDDLGLSAALESLTEATTRQGLACTFAESGERLFCAPEVEVTIYRIAQEALSNARRHAHAAAAAISLEFGGDAIHLTVSDDGAGFDSDAVLHAVGAGTDAPDGDDVEPLSGLGLLGMRERAALIGARLQLDSARGAGTRVTLRAPLRADAGGSSGARRRLGDSGARN